MGTRRAAWYGSSVIPLVVDTDTAADDCFALLVALLHPRADLKAITIVGGNVGFEQQVHNAFLTLEVAGRLGEVPVHLGSAEPLYREWVSAEDVHGDGVGGQRRNNDAVPESEGAVDALVRLSKEYEGELSLVCIGPLTNLALALRKDPAMAARLKQVVVMGGSINARGNITPAAEYNIYVDPEAAAAVLAAGIPSLRFVTWDPLTLQQAVLGPERLARIEALGTRLSQFFVTANQITYDFDVAAGLGGSTHPDTLSVLVALDDAVVTSERPYLVGVETTGTLTAGATVFDWRVAPEQCNATAIESIDEELLFGVLEETLARK